MGEEKEQHEDYEFHGPICFDPVPGDALSGKRAVPLCRCSTKMQAGESIPDQLAADTRFAQQHGMTVLEPVLLPGVSASVKPNLSKAIQKVLDRKASGEQIDVILIYDHSRFARTGGAHADQLRAKLERADIEVISVTGYMPEHPMSNMMNYLFSELALQEAVNISRNSTRGTVSSIESGRSLGTSRPPYGVDRLLKTPDGRPVAIFRNLADGTSQRVNAATREVEGVYERDQHGRSTGYKKGKADIVRFIPGEERAQAVVREIFEMHDLRGMGAYSIAGHLNDSGVRSPQGGLWSATVILDILNNPVYLGSVVSSRRAAGIHHVRGREGPAAQDRQVTRAGVRGRDIRPPTEWVVVDLPEMRDFLPERIRAVAGPRQERHWNDRYVRSVKRRQERERARVEQREPRTVGHHPGPKPTALLTHILHERTSGRPMKTIKRSAKHCYYVISGIDSLPGGSFHGLRRGIPREAADRLVLEGLESILCNEPELRRRLDAARDELARQDRREMVDPAERVRQIDRALGRLYATLETADEEQAAVVQDRVRALQREQTELKAAAAQDGDGRDLPPTDEILARLADFASSIEALERDAPEALRTFVRATVSEAVVDLDERHIEATLVLPSWAAGAPGTAGAANDSELGPVPGLEPLSGHWTHNGMPLVLGAFGATMPSRCDKHCRRAFRSSGRCGACRRQKRAA